MLQKTFRIQSLTVNVYKDKISLGKFAADLVAKRLKKVIKRKKKAAIVLATGISQFGFLDALKSRKDIDWKKITVFHLDEYKGISENHHASFRKYLKERIFNQVKPGQIYFIKGDAKDSQKECERYEALLKHEKIDIACIGIGENGHLAFNDPPVADFNDKKLVKIVTLDDACRKQQFGEGWFRSLKDVPRKAITLTIPAIMKAEMVSCVVPDKRKAQAVRDTLKRDITTRCPASILRKHDNVYLFLDIFSAELLGI